MTACDSNLSLKRDDVWIVLLLSLLAILSRVYGLSEWPINQDERFTITESYERIYSLVNPAYYALVVISFELFGVSEFSVRLPTFLLGACSIPIFFLTWRNVIGRNAALLGSILLIFSAWHLYHSQYARYYAGVFLFASLSYYLYYRAITQDRLSSLVWSLICALIAFFFHATAVMILSGCVVYSMFILLSRQRLNGEYSIKMAAIHFLICIIGGLIALPLLWQVVENWYSADLPWGIEPFHMLLRTLRDVQIPIAMAAIAGVAVLWQRDRLLTLFLSIGVVVPVLIIFAAGILVPIRTDYIFYTCPLLFALAGIFCERTRLIFPQNRFGSTVVTVILIAIMMPEFISHYTDKKSLDVREVVSFVEKHHKPNDKVIAFDGPFNYYSRERFTMEPRPGHRRDDALNWEEELEHYKNGPNRVWIVTKTGRRPLAKGLERWLLNNSKLVWRKYSKRFDSEVWKYEVYLVNDANFRLDE